MHATFLLDFMYNNRSSCHIFEKGHNFSFSNNSLILYCYIANTETVNVIG